MQRVMSELSFSPSGNRQVCLPFPRHACPKALSWRWHTYRQRHRLDAEIQSLPFTHCPSHNYNTEKAAPCTLHLKPVAAHEAVSWLHISPYRPPSCSTKEAWRKASISNCIRLLCFQPRRLCLLYPGCFQMLCWVHVGTQKQRLH